MTRTRLPLLLILAALFAPAGAAQAKGGHGGGHGGHGHAHGGASAISPGRQGAALAGPLRPVNGSPAPAAAASHRSGSSCGSRDERGNCMAPRVRPPDFSGP